MKGHRILVFYDYVRTYCTNEHSIALEVSMMLSSTLYLIDTIAQWLTLYSSSTEKALCSFRFCRLTEGSQNVTITVFHTYFVRFASFILDQ